MPLTLTLPQVFLVSLVLACVGVYAFLRWYEWK